MKQPELIQLPKFLDSRGNLSFVEQNSHIPFKIKRTYWIYDVPGGESRGGHAYRQNEEFLISLSGAFDVILSDGNQQLSFLLNRPYYGLYVPKGWWREMSNFSTNSVCLILSNTDYSKDDYVRDYNDFLILKGNGKI